MHNTEKVPSFVTTNLLTSHFTTSRFAVQITAKVSILHVNSAWQLRSDMWVMGSDMQNFITCSSWNVCRTLILQHKQVNVGLMSSSNASPK